MASKEEKKKLRKELSALLDQDPDWHKKPETNLYKKITDLGQKLSDSVPTRIKKEINKEQFLALREKGTSYSEIAWILGVPDKELKKWRVENQLD